MYLKVQGLKKQYGSRLVVDGIDLEIRPGQTLGLLGPNGAGKSTTIKMLSGQTKPTGGAIVIDDKEYSEIPAWLRGKIGVMPQEVIVWDDLSILENLTFTAALQDMSRDQIKTRIDYLVDGLSLSPELHTQARKLSGGYKRRLNLAISIIHDPSLVFLDEPSPGIDPQSRRFLWDFIRSLKTKDRSVVLTDHYLEEAEKLSDYVVIIDNGKVIAKGSVDTLKKKYGDGTLVNVRLEDVDKKRITELVKVIPEIKTTDDGFTFINQQAVKQIPQLMNTMDQLSMPVVDIQIKEPTLEDVFLILTGRNIRE